MVELYCLFPKLVSYCYHSGPLANIGRRHDVAIAFLNEILTATMQPMNYDAGCKRRLDGIGTESKVAPFSNKQKCSSQGSSA